RDCLILSVFGRSGFRYWIDQLFRYLSYLLYRRASLRRHCDLVTIVCSVSVVFAAVSSAVRSGLRCLGGLYAAGSFVDLVCYPTPASSSTFAKSTSGAARALKGTEKVEFKFQKGFDRTGQLS